MPFLFCFLTEITGYVIVKSPKAVILFPLRVKKTTNVSVDTAEPACMHKHTETHTTENTHTRTHTSTQKTHTHSLSLSLSIFFFFK